MDRRDFLKKGSLFAGIAGLNLPPGRPEWMKMPGQSSSKGREGPLSRLVTGPQGSHTPLEELHGIITPSDLVFERHHGGVPVIDAAAHRLMIHGLVERPLLFTIDDLKRFPSVTKTYFLECSGNSAGKWRPRIFPGGTVTRIHGGVACCEWTGVKLSLLIEEAGAKPEAKWILAEGADSVAFSRSIPMAKALDDALVVYAQNGEPLRPENGFPVRLLLPGFEGSMSVKWLRRLKLGDEFFDARDETARYTDVMPDGKARKQTFLMEAKSIITFPSGGQKIKKTGPLDISGLAWSGRGKIRKVEVSTDSGKSWKKAKLHAPVLTKCFTRFSLPWSWDGKPAVIMSRATDESGYVQVSLKKLKAVRGEKSYYHNNAIQCWGIEASGDVLNVDV